MEEAIMRQMSLVGNLHGFVFSPLQDKITTLIPDTEK